MLQRILKDASRMCLLLLLLCWPSACIIIGAMDGDEKTLAVVGGGAAGLVAAIAAGEYAHSRGVPLAIDIFEADERVGRSILVTGNGRCNFSNESLEHSQYRNAPFVGDVSAWVAVAYAEDRGEKGRKRVLRDGFARSFFSDHGLVWRVEPDGRLFPLANKASVVLDVLRASAAQAGAREVCGTAVRAIDQPMKPGASYGLRMADKRIEHADAVVVACGGAGIEAIDVAGMEKLEVRPMLGPLSTDTAPIAGLNNVRVRCKISLERGPKGQREVIAAEEGELMLRTYGVSGICVFNLSRFARPGDVLSINFLGDVSEEDAKGFLFKRRKTLAALYENQLSCDDLMRGLLLPRVADAVLKSCGLTGGRQFTKQDVPTLAHALTHFELAVHGIGDESICQVHRGGLRVDDFDASTLEAKEHPGLFAAGEALDVDGACGGFNLDWAWTSGYLAGHSAARSLVGGNAR